MRIGIVASVLAAACQATPRAPTAVRQSAVVPDVSAPAPTAPAPSVVVATPLPAPPAELADGAYWVHRIVGEGVRGSEGFSPGHGPAEHWVRLRTECQELTITTAGRRRDLAIGAVRFMAVPGPGGWTVTSSELTSQVPPVSLRRSCRDIVQPHELPVFADEASCQAAPPAVTRRCRGDTCRYDGDAPFALPTCDAAVEALETEAAQVTQASHDEALRSFRRLTSITARGGKLWLRDPEVDRCHPVTVTPRAGGAVALRQSIATPGGGRIELRAEVTFEPLYRRARFASESRWHEGPDGGGSSGTGPTTTGLFLGRDVILVGERWFYFDRKTCDARVPP